MREHMYPIILYIKIRHC